MIIAVAQIRPAKGDIPENIARHNSLIDLAIINKAKAIFFPELSVTGYETQLAKYLALSEGDNMLDEFHQISNQHKITIGLGMPTKTNSGIRISMIIFQPNENKQIYSKQQLYADETPFFENGEKQVILTVDNMKIAPAICYESMQLVHSEKASRLGAEIYMASVAKSQQGIEDALIHYPVVAKKFSMPVLMSNCVGECDNFLSVGQTSVWSKRGERIGQLDDEMEGVLIFNTATEEVITLTL